MPESPATRNTLHTPKMGADWPHRNADVMMAEHEDLVTPSYRNMHGDALGTVADLDLGAVIAHPELLACVLP